MITIFKNLYSLQPLMMKTAVFCLILVVACTIGWAFDPRLVVNVNTWLKPLKFSISFAVYLVTMIWVIQYSPEKTRSLLSMLLSAIVIVEMIAISIQAARGVPSHHNAGHPFDGLMYGSMGIAILVNTMVILYLTFIFSTQKLASSAVENRAIQLGLVLFLISSVIGAVMSLRFAHTVGAKDGTTGIFFFGWSKNFGDLRIAHFISMHGIQILLLAALFLTRVLSINERISTAIIFILFFFVLGISVSATILAFKGFSPFSWLS